MTEKELEAAASGFLDTAFNLGEPETAVSEHVGGKFVQHNPQVADGAEAFIGFVHSMRSQFPEMHLEGYSGGRSVMRSLFPLRRAAQ